MTKIKLFLSPLTIKAKRIHEIYLTDMKIKLKINVNIIRVSYISVTFII
jgi:hypothetical protein